MSLYDEKESGSLENSCSVLLGIMEDLEHRDEVPSIEKYEGPRWEHGCNADPRRHLHYRAGIGQVVM